MKLDKKAPEIEKALRSIFPNRGTGLCAICGSDKTNEEDFTDDLSRKEYRLSAMCQVCQDGFYSEGEDE